MDHGDPTLSTGTLEVREGLFPNNWYCGSLGRLDNKGLYIRLSVRESIFTSYLLWTSNGMDTMRDVRFTITFHILVLI